MASRGVNKEILVGNLGNDPETRYMPSGGAVTNITIATSEVWKDKENGQQQERTEWHRIVFFNRLAEIAGEYLKKGSKIYVDGSLRTRKWQDQGGVDRYTTEVVASELQMLDRQSGDGAQNNAQNNNQGQQRSNANNGNAGNNQQQRGNTNQQRPANANNGQQRNQAQQSNSHAGNQNRNQQPPHMDQPPMDSYENSNNINDLQFDDDIPF